VLEAMAPLGEPYAAALRQAFDDRWIDWRPSAGKRAGAYMNGAAWDVHPYVLMNYQQQYSDLSTLAHELGHAMHSHFSNRMQPFPTAGYHTFVAEVASTFNEALLHHHLVRHEPDPATRLSLLGTYLESLKGTVFRQTQFAEFELRMHERAWQGEALTGPALAELYLAITRRYYGHDAGVCLVGDEVAHEWSYVPHFYREFYVFQYATSFTAAAALSSRVLEGDEAATARYLTFLGSGGSDYPIALLQQAGVDMTSDDPLDRTIARMHAVMDEMEALVDAGA
jgi:oligoendopeptidase F